MSGSHQILATALDIPDISNEEEASAAILARLTSAVRDENPQVPLKEILHGISEAGAVYLIDPLNTLPLLLSCRDEAAKDIISLMGECSSAKEVVMAVQEAIERMEILLSEEYDQLDEESLPPPSQLVTLIELYSSSIPRLKPRQKSGFETINPLLIELRSTIPLAGTLSTRDEGRRLIASLSYFTKNVAMWLKTRADMKNADILTCHESMKSLLGCALEACAHTIHSSLAQRSFELYFPQLIINSALEPGWEVGSETILSAIDAYQTLGYSATSLLATPSKSDMIIFAHSDTDSLERNYILSQMVPILLASIQANSALDEALTILLKALNPQKITPQPELSPEIIIPLCIVLPSLCNSHPDPLVRHQAFRILSNLLFTAPPPLRLRILSDLTTDKDLPQMQVAAVGLTKEIVLHAFSSEPSIFTTPTLLQVFGPIILRPSPPDLFSLNLTMEKFLETSEPQRLTECLAFYYIILQRDKSNLTGIRDPDVLRQVEKSLLGPLRSTLVNWLGNSLSIDGDMHNLMLLVSLKVGLERVDAARATLGNVSI